MGLDPSVRKLRRLLSLCALSYCFAAPAVAQHIPDCYNGPQQDLNQCAWMEYERADAYLNEIWPVAMSYARNVGAEEQLRDAQRLWITYRDAACAAEAAPFDGGSLQPLILAGCLTRLTNRRIADLENYRAY